MMQHLLAEEFMHGECEAMCPTPCHKVETRAMPQPTQEHCDDEIDILTQLAFAVATQGDINVVANPCGERDVPAPPKVGDAHRAIRGVEVDGEMETQQQGYANGHVAIAAEVAIDLQRVAINAEQIF